MIGCIAAEKEGDPIARHSFVQMAKLTNVKGRITYITSRKKQENLYAVYETTDRKFWRELAKCNQEDFLKSGTKGKCIEARELDIALPESFVDYQPDMLLKLFTEQFKQSYGVECISALHHNKRKTNYHIHLIFSERKLLDEPIVKIASRNMFYDENGKHVRTKKEILDEAGQIRTGCRIIKKGEVYERKLFTVKDEKYKNEGFLEEVKHFYADLINIYVRNDTEKLEVFDRSGPYLATKKVGKNNPKAEQIEADNKHRQEWNNEVDRALVSGVPEQQIMVIRKAEISGKVKESIARDGKQPQRFAMIVMVAVAALELLINQVLKKLEVNRKNAMEKENQYSEQEKEVESESDVAEEKGKIVEKMGIPEQPQKTPLAAKFNRLSGIYKRMDKENHAIYQQEKKLVTVKTELANTKGIFKGKQRKELQEQISSLDSQIDNMKRYLSGIVQGYGYKTVKEFLAEYKMSKAEYSDYQLAIAKWEKETGQQAEADGVMAKLKAHQKKEKEQKQNVQHNRKKDRDAR